MRSIGVIVILAVAITLSISMLIARDAVNSKINSVKASSGTTINVAPKGFFGFNGGGTPLKQTKIDTLLDLKNVTSLQVALSEQLSSSTSNLTSPTPTGSLGGRFPGAGNANAGTGSTGQAFTIPIRVIGTNSPGNALVGGANGGGTEKLTSGKAFAPPQRLTSRSSARPSQPRTS